MSIATSPLRVTQRHPKSHSCQSKRWLNLANAILGSTVVALVMLAQGCGGGGSTSAALNAPSNTTTPTETGTLLVAFTDAEGDFTSYAVDVESLKLHRANGDTVETVPLTTRIDFTQLTEVTEFFTTATIPVGIYSMAEITLNFDGAEIIVQDADGNDLAATVLDRDGNPAAQMTLELMLADNDRIRIAPGVPALFSLDFDLDASNSIDLGVSPPVVTVEPFLLATPELEDDRAHRVRGVLASVNLDAASFTLKIRPFRHRQGQFGEIDVHADADTHYDVDGEIYMGDEGLRALAALAENAPVVTQGDISDRGLLANTVVAGSSVAWDDADGLRGTVTARSGNSMTVSGGVISVAAGEIAFRGDITLLVGDATQVVAFGADIATLGIASISIGSRVQAIGEIADDRTFDATQGRVRLQQTRLAATVVNADPLELDLLTLGKRRVAIFDFSGTGVTAAEDSDPDLYEINIASLVLSDLNSGDFVRLSGLVHPFGMAAPDFDARTLLDFNTDRRAANLIANWVAVQGTTTPFNSLSTERIDVNLDEARAGVKLRGIPSDVLNPLDAIAMIAPGDDRGAYSVRVRGDKAIHVYRSFAEMTTELARQLDVGRKLVSLSAHGVYNASESELITHRAGFQFVASDE